MSTPCSENHPCVIYGVGSCINLVNASGSTLPQSDYKTTSGACCKTDCKVDNPCQDSCNNPFEFGSQQSLCLSNISPSNISLQYDVCKDGTIVNGACANGVYGRINITFWYNTIMYYGTDKVDPTVAWDLNRDTNICELTYDII